MADGLCDTCRQSPARYLAHHCDSGDTWVVCGTCRDQANRLLRAGTIIHHPLTFPGQAA